MPSYLTNIRDCKRTADVPISIYFNFEAGTMLLRGSPAPTFKTDVDLFKNQAIFICKLQQVLNTYCENFKSVYGEEIHEEVMRLAKHGSSDFKNDSIMKYVAKIAEAQIAGELDSETQSNKQMLTDYIENMESGKFSNL